MVPDSLVRLLQQHRDAYAPQYPPEGNSDHWPMACLAMHGLGMDPDRVMRFAQDDRGPLAPLQPLADEPFAITAADWASHCGNAASYAVLLRYFDERIAADGWRRTVQNHLPHLISGWVRHAFHPLIRLAYGIAFGVPAEISAGLAYLVIAGPDPALAQQARRTPSGASGRGYLLSMQAANQPVFTQGRFNTRYAHIVRDAVLPPARPQADGIFGSDLSRASLEVFHATHDFFALHMVTGSHAMRVCAPWAGSDAEPLFSVGIAAAYHAIGAPDFAPLGPLTGGRLQAASLHDATDVHDIKLAHSCMEQARVFQDPAYEAVAAAYQASRDAAAPR